MLPLVALIRHLVTRLTFLHGTAERLLRSDLDRIGRYRHRVFVDGLGWQLESHRGIERDQFDRLDTWHVAAIAPQTDRLVGVARLLPTHRPYLLADVFPQLVSSIPRDRGIWELSRFAAADDVGAAPRSQIASPIAVQLMRQVLAIAEANQVHRLITVSPVGMLRLLKTSGFAAERAGRSTVVDGARLEALWIDVPPIIRASSPPTFPSQPLSHAQRPLHGVGC
jgi:N-acyl-L-homoserine lactone synthetase